jgi:hypothetical protein
MSAVFVKIIIKKNFISEGYIKITIIKVQVKKRSRKQHQQVLKLQ